MRFETQQATAEQQENYCSNQTTAARKCSNQMQQENGCALAQRLSR
jgi:hypothetical protein